ncbi:MAG: hypothetical protein QG629_348 [Patescibacteria group bacterium]|nr:DUF937 domain-containing protein [Candidatus Saccharibacteria bacterium]MDQ5963266.1 hypothetical protein [Patescibacteria group bacterium]
MEQAIKDAVLQQVTGKVKDAISQRTGLDGGAADDAIDTALNTILGGLQGSVKSEKGAEALDTAVTQDHSGGMLEDLASSVADGSLQGDGAKILGHIFGQKNTETVAENAAKTAGTDTGAMADVLSTLAPIVLNQLGQSKKSEGLDAGDIADKILRQQLPKGQMTNILTGLLDRDNDGQIIDDILDMGQGFLKKK